MGALDSSYKDTINYSKNFRDLRFIQDDKIVLRNPHKGWYWHYIDNGYRRENYRAKHEKGDWLLDFPGLNHLYLRFDWSDIEKAEGVYDWSYIDEIMSQWGSLGYRFSFRICTYEAANNLAFAIPEYVVKLGAKGKFFNGAWEPDYGDPIFLNKLSVFMAEFGKKFNGDPRVETIDVGTFGTWGEGHTYAGSDTPWSIDTMIEHIKLHVKNFPDTYILLNDDYINHRGKLPKEENDFLLNYAVDKGLGIRDDSLCVAYYSKVFGYDTLRSGWMFDHFQKQAPVDIEFEHFQNVAPDVFKEGFPFLAGLIRTKATFAGFHGYPRLWLEKHYDFTEYCANRLGYWYFLEGIDLPELTAGLPSHITFYWRNAGFSHCYFKFNLKIRLCNVESREMYIINLSDSDNRNWLPNIVEEERLKINVPKIKTGIYEFAIGIFERENPILLGIKKDNFDNIFYKVATVKVN